MIKKNEIDSKFITVIITDFKKNDVLDSTVFFLCFMTVFYPQNYFLGKPILIIIYHLN